MHNDTYYTLCCHIEYDRDDHRFGYIGKEHENVVQQIPEYTY